MGKVWMAESVLRLVGFSVLALIVLCCAVNIAPAAASAEEEEILVGGASFFEPFSMTRIFLSQNGTSGAAVLSSVRPPVRLPYRPALRSPFRPLLP